jgi:hypothetical protein
LNASSNGLVRNASTPFAVRELGEFRDGMPGNQDDGAFSRSSAELLNPTWGLGASGKPDVGE